MSKRSTRIEALTFEQAISQLEALVEQIESGEVGLEEALKQYEHGIALIGRCKTVLDAAETRITELTRNARGDLAIDGNAAPEEPDNDADDDNDPDAT